MFFDIFLFVWSKTYRPVQVEVIPNLSEIERSRQHGVLSYAMVQINGYIHCIL